MRSPEYVKMSHATAISLGLVRGRMFRGAVNRCVNLLVHYPEGCAANCAYCGLATKRPGSYREKTFIHVDWPTYSMDEVVAAVRAAPLHVQRTCISMITNGKCRPDTTAIARRLRGETSLPISVLISPTILANGDLRAMKDAGVDKVGVALDLATPELFDRHRGRGVNGPHDWQTYWDTLGIALDVFGPKNVGAHLMVGMGETEKDMVDLMTRLWRLGVVNHLFSFFAEDGSRLADRPQPAWDNYLRIQLARYFIEEGKSAYPDLGFDDHGRIRHFGVGLEELNEAIDSGVPFMTTGCLGPDGEVACNRPFGNCLPDIRQWNYPYMPNRGERDLIRQEILKALR